MIPYTQEDNTRGGFALVIALSLMAFVLLLLLSISTLVRVETNSVQNQVSLLRAHENAKLGLFIALGELQKHAGTDTAVSAEASLLDTAPETRFSDGIRNPHWTGIWKVDGGAALAPSPAYALNYANWASDYRLNASQNAAWLISGNAGKSVADADYLRPNMDVALTNEMVTLYGESGSGLLSAPDGDLVEVQAPVQEILDRANGLSGRYAYWVSDNGVKAQARFLDPFKGQGGDLGDFRSLSPANVAVGSFPSLAGLNVTTSDFGQRINQLADFNLAASLGLSRADLGALGHGLTVSSRGVLADIRTGGLKKDLSAAMTSDIEFNSLLAFSAVRHAERSGYGDPVGQIFSPQANVSANDNDRGGPRWEQLKSYFDLATATAPYPVAAQTDEDVGLSPILAGAQLYAGPQVVTPGVGGTMRLHLFPAVVLWNPYDVDLEPTNYTVAFGKLVFDDMDNYAAGDRYMVGAFGRIKLLRPGVQYDITTQELIHPEAGRAYESYADLSLPQEADTYVFTIKGAELKAGESIVFSAGAQSVYDRADPSKNVLSSGFNDTAVSFTWDKNIQFEVDDGGTDYVTKVNYFRDASYTVGLYRGVLSAYNIDALGNQGHANFPILQQVSGLNWARENRGGVTSEFTVPTSGPPMSPLSDVFGIKMRLLYSDNTDPLVLPRGGSGWMRVNAATKWLANMNPRARFSGLSKFEAMMNAQNASFDGGDWPEAGGSNPSYDVNQNANSDRADMGIVDFGSGATPVGYDATSPGGPTTASLFEVPKSLGHLQSIGQLMHANLFKLETPGSEPNVLNLNHHDFAMERIARYGRYANFSPAYAIGNSLADPRIALDQTYTDFGDSQFTLGANRSTELKYSGFHYDSSYLLNDALWDNFFLSGLSQSDWSTIGVPAYDVPNQRLELRSEISSSDLFNTAAGNFLVDGAFNVNSTSVEAWAAFIGGFLGVSPGSDEGSEAFYSRLVDPLSNALDVSSGSPESDEEAYNGYRTLSQAQLTALATEVVKEVKERGPFLSMSDFVNRRLVQESGNVQNQLMGVFQEAILASNLNDRFERNALESDLAPYGSADALIGREIQSQEETSTASAVPGHLSQADMLARLGSVLQARSDTFTIRAYGGAVSMQGSSVETEVWCEAVVQRLPEFVDSTDASHASLGALSSDVNERFGRRFKIIHFRWLDKDEI